MLHMWHLSDRWQRSDSALMIYRGTECFCSPSLSQKACRHLQPIDVDYSKPNNHGHAQDIDTMEMNRTQWLAKEGYRRDWHSTTRIPV